MSELGDWMLPQLSRWLALTPRAPSEYRVANLYLYRDRHAYRLNKDAKGPAIIGTTYDGERHALPLGPLTPDRAMALLAHVDCIYPLDEAEAAFLCANAPLEMYFNPADSDYLFCADALSRLANAKKKRSQARAFERDAKPRIENLTAQTRHLAQAVLEGWLQDVERPRADTDFSECEEALARLDGLDLSGHVVVTGSTPVGFIIAGGSVAGERVLHFAKGRRRHAGVYPWMFASFGRDAGVACINFEQDLGKPGLAQSKRAFGPCALRHKFRIKARSPG